MTKQLDKEDLDVIKNILELYRALEVNILMNRYTIENVVFNKLNPKDKIPFDKFIEEMNLQNHKFYSVRSNIEGIAITSDETVAEKDKEFYLKECYTSQMNYLFMSAPKHSSDSDVGEVDHFKYGLSDYIMSLYPLFVEIIETEVEYEPCDLFPIFPSRAAETDCYEKIGKFLVAVKIKALQTNRCVDRYLKDLPYIPHFLKKIIKVHKNRYLLVNNDTTSLDYKLAILNAMQFMNPNHTKIFEMKAIKWENKFNERK